MCVCARKREREPKRENRGKREERPMRPSIHSFIHTHHSRTHRLPHPARPHTVERTTLDRAHPGRWLPLSTSSSFIVLAHPPIFARLGPLPPTYHFSTSSPPHASIRLTHQPPIRRNALPKILAAFQRIFLLARTSRRFPTKRRDDIAMPCATS
jgi:hypothetical protein